MSNLINLIVQFSKLSEKDKKTFKDIIASSGPVEPVSKRTSMIPDFLKNPINNPPIQQPQILPNIPQKFDTIWLVNNDRNKYD